MVAVDPIGRFDAPFDIRVGIAAEGFQTVARSGVTVVSQIARALAVRELMLVAGFNDVVHFSVPDTCIYKSRTKKMRDVGFALAPKNLTPNPFPKWKGNRIEDRFYRCWEGGKVNLFLVPLPAREGVRG